MRIGKRFFGLLFIAAVLVASGAAPARAGDEPGGHYWDWGFGVNVNRIPQDPLDAARYDWSTIMLGNVGMNQGTLDHLNRVLELNPEHRFLLRVWPVMNLGARNPQNRFQTTMWDYFYTPGQKERVLETLERQISFFLEGLDRPESIVAIVFCEELPSPVATNLRRWSRDELPWDIAAFAEPIEADLGEPFDMSSVEHRLWWGRKFAEFLGEMHREIKRVSGGRMVVFWPQIAMVGTLDELEEDQPFEISESGASRLPVYYRDIVKPGLCDVIFGYPGNRFEERTVNPARELGCLYFTQVSTAGFMRRHNWDRIVSIARQEDPLNLGTFVHIERDRAVSAHHAVPWRRGQAFETWPGDARGLGWHEQLGIDVLERNLVPEVALDYDLEAVADGGHVQVFAQVFNPVCPSWYGGDADRATFRDLSVRIEAPEGFRVSPDLSAPAVVEFGDLAPWEHAVADWWLEKTVAGLPEAPLVRVVVGYNGESEAVLESPALSSEIPALKPRRVAGLGESWVEPAYRLGDFDPAVAIEPLGRDLVHPSLSSGGRTVTWQDTLKSDEILVIGPGVKAEIADKPLFSESVLRFGGDDEGRSFSDGYNVFRTPAVTARPGRVYRFTLTGRAEGGADSGAMVRFTVGGERRDVQFFMNRFGTESRTIETEVTVPGTEDDGPVRLQVFFYRMNQEGTVHYRDFSFDSTEPARDGSDRLSGTLRPLERFATGWEFSDRGDPDYHARPVAAIRFFDPGGKERARPAASPFF